MIKKRCPHLILSLIFFSLAILVSCTGKSALDKIMESGEIVMLTRNNAHCYYIYRDDPMGFEYELAKAFSDHLGVKLRVVATPWADLFEELQKGKGDFIAANLTILPSRKELIDFSDEYLKVQQRAILHRRNYRIKESEDLAGKTIHVRRSTSYEERLKQLKEQGLDIKIKLYKDTPTEELIRMVAEKEIEITISDSNIALLNRRYFPDINIAFPIEEPQYLGWGIKKGEKELKNKINKFFKKIKKGGTFAKIYEKYYANVEIFDYVDLKKYHQRLDKRLPVYRDTIKNAAKKYGFDWRLIAAMIYQESHFNPRARSYTGVRGLMQLTLKTAEEMGIKNRLDPKQSIKGGVKYLKKLYDAFDKAKNPDKMLIALAGYNVGRGHILDAQKIAVEKGFNPNSWSALEEILPLLRYPRYYKKTKYGYCRGTEPVRYVSRIITYYDILKREAFAL